MEENVETENTEPVSRRDRNQRKSSEVRLKHVSSQDSIGQPRIREETKLPTADLLQNHISGQSKAY
jgi:hypothetical protein